jgi:hypothetical protein
MCFDFLSNLSETSLVLRITERGIIIRVYWSSRPVRVYWSSRPVRVYWSSCPVRVYWSSCPVPVILSILMKRAFSRHFFEEYSNIKCHENPSSRSRSTLRRGRLLDRQTDRETDDEK